MSGVNGGAGTETAMRKQSAKPRHEGERWRDTLGYASAMFAAYLLIPVSFLAALAASSGAACLYLAALAWRRRTLSREAARPELLTSVEVADPLLIPKRSRFWCEFLPIYVN
ncbi:MAG: hypothetical protein F4117_00710 [Acidimicrobiales bacterium]|nr:hypothetical protein [Acidimicrobiales bacterium]MXZ14914.1 hypothetical protein [Acidimicrobiales bacterium]MYB80833.1 hypothetical protein [Acidimicrobiales bacterium]MYG60563.1 hypothetical protein [Acidimicrobiales bacterium]MYI11073.1 hypothetical protein [Acidimicrobiales bacterium]